jgi:L-lysine exporter family protein LysE/ArgO
LSLFITGFLLSLSLCLDIGIVNIAIFREGIEKGFKSALEIGIGSTAGDLIYAVLSFTGIGFLLKYEPVKWILWIGGTIVLLYLSINLIMGLAKKGTPMPEFNDGKRKTRKNNFTYGMLLALASPSAIIWYVTVGGSLIASQPISGIPAYVYFLTGFIMAAILWSFFWAGLSFYSGKLMPGRIRLYLSLISAVIFLVLAGINFIRGYQVLIVL